uniref:Putative LRR receptor-like serine/threonine-protein kinase At1g06840 n=1 Tax=Rhizophora mucronata TaxID=61149 RepID=A0A2P2M580_RHIMU
MESIRRFLFLTEKYLNLQEFQRFDVTNFLRYTPTYVVPHKVQNLHIR